MAQIYVSGACCLLILLSMGLDGLACRRVTEEINARDQSAGVYQCGVCGQPITVTLVVRNELVEPHFEHQVTVTSPQRELIHILEAAATSNPHFKFSADFHGSLGYLIYKINNLSSADTPTSYWNIVEHETGNSTLLGASAYVPIDDQTILFNFTTWDTKHQ